jgi:hypothetical protein
MGRAIKRTCSHCQREIYFDPRVGVSFDALSSLSCSECGHSGAVLMLDVEAPPNVVILDRLPGREEAALRTFRVP